MLCVINVDAGAVPPVYRKVAECVWIGPRAGPVDPRARDPTCIPPDYDGRSIYYAASTDVFFTPTRMLVSWSLGKNTGSSALTLSPEQRPRVYDQEHE